MALYKTINSEGGTAIYVWKIEESLAELKDGLQLTENSINRIKGMKSELHQKGFLSVRNLLVLAGYEDANLRYNEYGKPLLNNGKHISITHSFEFAAILISDREAGVDIEKNREKIVKIQHRFVNTEVDSLSDEDLVKQLTVIWGAKESMYKTYPYGGLSFHDHIGINPFLFADGRSSGRVIFGNWKKEYEIKFEFFREGFTLVYAIEKVN
ncbi:4'-phosphopantetheinyl transferase superfamily protein [Lutimonas saemankumensis]|uniref:4'-phosphopantetheinyl transferase superfamily protein n=1 Tax=Lutimonas saemankumensis TaxID=483016 RepID=UPI001CD290D6|nr:4'-phosphopantetheinyl transferase superfamily protein [Lutimonas saemankumensis]MCA0932850.1 4'-phosphopantetheinyl transferase superfamily protein [Lutimonas saemankumensis]